MKIALIHDFLTKNGGAERVLLSLSEIFPEAPIYTLLYDEEGTKGYFKNKKIISSGLQRYPVFLRRPRFLLAKFPFAIEQFNLSKYDVVISSSNSFAKGVITKPKTFHLSYCHSPMRYAWDWYHEYLDEHNLGFGLKGLLARSILQKVRMWDKVSSQRVDSWLANSKNVQERIQKYYRKSSMVLYPPVNIENIKLLEEKEDFYLILSRLEPYKNIEIAVKAFNQNGKKLIVVGEGSQANYLKNLAKKNIAFLGWQADKKVHELLSKARALVFPGEEDFGIVPVEAMAAGTPVIALGTGGILESVLEGKTGLFFDESTSKSLNDCIQTFEKCKWNARTCRHQAEKFSNSIFQEQFKEILDRELIAYRERYEN